MSTHNNILTTGNASPGGGATALSVPGEVCYVVPITGIVYLYLYSSKLSALA